MARKRRVPEVLWRLFHNSARTLAETILALVPPPPAECRCRGRRCLSCMCDQAMSFILGPEDPPEYRKLLTGCYAVVSENAPPIPVFDPHCRWPQREIVRRSIEMILYEEPSSSNLICCGYDKANRSSGIIDILMSPAWILLLTRVGDALMMYLLKYTSIFLPLPRHKHHQIIGFPISELSLKLSSSLLESKSHNHPLTYCGKKRKKADEDESIVGKQLCSRSLGVEPSSNSIRHVDSLGPHGSWCSSKEEFTLKKSEGTSKPNVGPCRKRKRLYRWQRQIKRKQLAIQETRSLMMPGEVFSNNNCVSIGLQNAIFSSSVQSDETNMSQCFCCLVFRNLPKLAKSAEIRRRNIFYRLENSSSVFPKKHILNRLKPNEFGATVLFNNIFGIPGMDKNSQALQCVHSKSSYPIKSDCLYHYLIKLLKSLIRKTRNCRHLRLLDKHCSVTAFYESASKGPEPMSQENDDGKSITASGCCGGEIEGQTSHDDTEASCKMFSEATNDLVEPSKSYCLKKQVIAFIWAICRRIVPVQLLGATSNWRILRKNISKFIQLRKFEKFSLKQCTHKLKISKFPLLLNNHFACGLSFNGMGHSRWLSGYMDKGCSEFAVADLVRHKILECWMFWLFTQIVSPLVQANFYVTESENEKQEVSYYRKSYWKKLLREAENGLKDQSYCQLNHASTRKILEKRSFGFSRIRLCPKRKGFRVLANLQASSKIPHCPLLPGIHFDQHLGRTSSHNLRSVKFESFKSVNSVLHDLHVVLKGIQTIESDKLGSSVFDYNDVHRKLVPFLFNLKNGPAPMPSAFLVVSDVSKAFDSLNQDKLLDIMKDVMSYDEFTLEKYIQVICTKKSLKVHQRLVLSQQGVVSESEKIRRRLPAHSSDSILVKKAFSRKIRKEEFNVLLKEHIKHNVVQLDKKFYLQRVGIPQGSVLSTLLCSFYYGHMERKVVFPFLEKSFENISGDSGTCGALISEGNHTEEIFARTSESLLLRFIDDFLFISTSKKQASMFFSRLERGVREYNCYMNKEKYGLNFNMNSSQGFLSNRLHVGKDGVSFLRWSGLLINCSTLEIQADYTRYLNSHLSSTLTVSCRGKVGCKLKAKLCDYLRPKCHPIFYDSNINSSAVVRLNIYQVFLLCAMKFLCYISDLSSVPKFHPKFLINSIDASLRYMHRLIKRKMYTFESEIDFRPKYKIKKNEILWLGFHAYSRVVKKKQSRCKKLFHYLTRKLKALEKVENISSDLSYATDDTHSSALWSIKY
ncbi:telomerase reverse transcriptase isoform X1 [Primulina eburnea]|uniref:telomerase reverse transcriptase isoform X1 n=2 Tax=Primulina eburnea TaxID=1245227 RepID=UPI003C6C250F